MNDPVIFAQPPSQFAPRPGIVPCPDKRRGVGIFALIRNIAVRNLGANPSAPGEVWACAASRWTRFAGGLFLAAGPRSA